MKASIDETLRTSRKGLRTIPGKLLLGPTGARLWADYLDPLPGFSGRIDFIHKLNIPFLYRVSPNVQRFGEPCEPLWHPSHLHVRYAQGGLHCEEWKWVTWDDCAVTYQIWRNEGETESRLALELPDAMEPSDAAASWVGAFPGGSYSFAVSAALACSQPRLVEGMKLRPGEQCEIVLAAALGITGQDSSGSLSARADKWRAMTCEEALRTQREDYQRWFDEVPCFVSSDPLLDRTWAYRWFILRHNLAEPRYGKLQHPLFYEGRSHKKSKEPDGGSGWEFSKLINLSVPLHLLDARWHKQIRYAEGALFNMQDNPGEDGLFSCLTVDDVLHDFADFSCWGVYQLYLIHRNEATIRRLLPALKRQFAAWEQKYGNAHDHLMTEHWHTRTGKEYQPSYWYFHNYPDDPKDRSTYTPVKRVDRTVYHYLNAQGIGKLCAILDDPDAGYYEGEAARIRQDVLDKMWNDDDHFFYDLHPQTDEQAKVKNIVGFYPLWAQMLERGEAELAAHLFDRQTFATGVPYPSVAADCPLYSSEGGWKGRFIKGRNGCMWNGPAWPYTTGIVLDALAKLSKRSGHRYDEAFGHQLREYAYLHFQQRDLQQPALVEHYSSRSGEPLSDEPEYNHSHCLDLLITHVAGLEVREDCLIVDPLDIGLDHFSLTGVQAVGCELGITYCKAELAQSQDMLPGLALYVNGDCVARADRLQQLTWRFHTDKTGSRRGANDETI